MLPALKTSVPGPRSRALAGELRRWESRNVTYIREDFPVFWESASGVNVTDVDGNRYLDFTSAFAVAGLGHARPEIVEALTQQAARLPHAMGDVHPTEGKVELCRKLSEITFERWGCGPGKTILASSGSEAVEAALKSALMITGKPGVIAFEGGYHGLGHGALTASGLTYFRDPFLPQLGRFAATVPYPACYRCPFGQVAAEPREGNYFPVCSEECLSKIRLAMEEILALGQTGCILVEPVQGRGGDRVPPLGFLTLLRSLADEHGVVLVFDEIYTGFNRTGHLFAADHFEVVPDLICLGKGLSSLFPISACVGRAALMDAWPESNGEALHTSTFLGNPVGCAAALASVDLHLQEETRQAVRQLSAHLRLGLSRIGHPAIGQVRGLGLMIGVEMVGRDGEPDPATAGGFVTYALQSGLLVLAGGPAGNVISLSPPFFMTTEEADLLPAVLQEYLTSRFGSVS